MVTVVGKVINAEIVPLAESDFEYISGDPLIDDVFMREGGGKVYKKTTQGEFDVTHEYCELAGWELYEPPLQESEVL